MKNLLIVLFLTTIFYSCSKQKDNSLEAEINPPFSKIEFGEEINSNGIYHYQKLQYQDTISFLRLSNLNNLVVNIKESGTSYSEERLAECEQTRMEASTKNDSEVFEAGINCNIRGRSLSEVKFSYTIILPIKIDSIVLTNNSILEFLDNEDDFIQIKIKSAVTGRVFSHKLYIIN